MNESPFDAIKQVRDDGSEFWSARNLMPLLGYQSWQKFTNPLLKAAKSTENQGYDLGVHFIRSDKVAASGPMAMDYQLSRLAAYLVAMNCDPNKDQVAMAQGYFAIKTRQAETAQVALPSRKQLAQMVIEAEELLEIEQQARLEAEGYAKQLEAPASAWKELAEADGDYSIADAAKVLSRDSNIDIGRDRLFMFMQAAGWVYRDQFTRKWKAYQTQITTGRLAEKVSRPVMNPKTGTLQVFDPSVRVTPKGLEELHKRLGGSGPVGSLASVG